MQLYLNLVLIKIIQFNKVCVMICNKNTKQKQHKKKTETQKILQEKYFQQFSSGY